MEVEGMAGRKLSIETWGPGLITLTLHYATGRTTDIGLSPLRAIELAGLLLAAAAPRLSEMTDEIAVIQRRLNALEPEAGKR